MKVFISWSGEKSKLLGISLRNWVPLVLQYAKPWLSDKDITSGGRWSLEIARQLDDAQFGIICVTKENLAAPWIFFEAGALSKAVTASLVCPYLMDVEFGELVGPLTQFQARKADKGSTLQLLESLNQKASTPVPAAHLAKVFEALWPDLEKEILAIPQIQTTLPPRRSPDAILEEVVSVVRSTEQRLERLETAFGKAEWTLESARAPITEDDVIEAFAKIPYLKRNEVEALASDCRHWLTACGVRTVAELNRLVTAKRALNWLEDVYVNELLRSREAPLDPLAIAVFGAQLFRQGFTRELQNHIVNQVRKSPEYAEKHKSAS